MTAQFEFADDLGPEKIVQIYDPLTELKAVVVIDNVAAGPAIGGIRMAMDVTVEECFRLARAMTLKNAAAGLRHGGGKSVIVGDPAMPQAQKERLIRSFADAIKDLKDYIPGPDMGTNETCMAWIRDMTGRVVGLPREIGGIPLDEIGATALGLRAALEAAQEYCDLELNQARLVVQGFGSVGKHVARFLAEKGARLVAASDSQGCCYNPDGLDVHALIQFKNAGNSVANYPEGQALARDAVLDVECDVWIPAARPDVLTMDNVERLKTKVVAEGANIPATPEVEAVLANRGVLVLPDFVANAGGVICGAVEWANGSEAQAVNVIQEKISANVQAMLELARAEGKLPRDAAMDIAKRRVLKAMSFRRTG